MMKSVLATVMLVAFFACVSAMPAEDAVVPEAELYQGVEADRSDFEAVTAEVKTLFTKGKSDADCRKLGNDSKKELRKTVKSLQRELDLLPTGKKCKDKGQKTVKSTKETLDKAHKTLMDAKKAHEDSKKKKLTFTVTLDKMTKDDWWKKSSAYKKAVDARKKAKSAKEVATGSHTTAKTEYDKAVKAAAKAKKICLCKVKKKHAEGWKKAKKPEKANEKLWRKAHLLLCVLDGTPEKKCEKAMPPCPQVKKPKNWDAEVESVKGCSSSGGGDRTFTAMGYSFDFVKVPRKYIHTPAAAKNDKWMTKLCKAVGKLPVCELHRCWNSKDSISIGPNHNWKWSTTAYRAKNSWFPSGWSKVKAKFQTWSMKKGLCYFTGGNCMCSLPGDCKDPKHPSKSASCKGDRAWNVPSVWKNYPAYKPDNVVCAKKL